MRNRNRSEAIREFFEKHPSCTTPSKCDKHVSEMFDCSETAARAARYRVFPKSATRPWKEAEKRLEEVGPDESEKWVTGKEKAVPTHRVSTGKGRPRLVFEDGFPRTEFPHVCPKTGTTATTPEEADKLFGWRCVGKYEDGTPHYTVQSWCRQARADEAAKRRARARKRSSS